LFTYYHLIIILLKQSLAAHQVHFLVRQHASTHSMQCTEQAASQLSRFHHKGPVASKFTEPNRLLRVGCNVRGLLQA